MSKEIKEILIFDSSDLHDNNNYDFYKEDCEEREIECGSEDSRDFYDWRDMMCQQDIDDFWDNLESCKVNYPLMIEGSCGLWYGRREIVPEVIESSQRELRGPHKGKFIKVSSLYTAISKATKECDDLDVTFKDGAIYVNGYHHDGTNSFIIRKLSKYGCERKDGYTNTDKEYKITKRWFSKIKEDELF